MREIPYFKPYLGVEEKQEIISALESGWISTGPKNIEFEKKFRECLSIPKETHLSAISSATAGLHLALSALGADENTCIFLPTMTFTATAEIATYCNSRINLVDSLPNEPNIDLQLLRDKIALCKAKKIIVILVHFGGTPIDVPDFLRDLDHRVMVVEDAAHALPASINGVYVGNFGSAATVFSFYANKTMTTGEGGMIVCGNDQIAKKIGVLKSHGIDRSAFDRFQGRRENAWEYDVVEAGFKYNLSDLLASIGVAQLSKLHAMNARRKEIVDLYTEAFAHLPIERPLQLKKDYLSANHIFSIELNESAPISRNVLIKKLYGAGISTSVHYKPLHMMSYWSKLLDIQYGDFPHAEKRFTNTISLPLYPGMTDEDVQYVISKVVTSI